MNRRSLLGRVGSIVGCGLAGCLDSDDRPNGDDPNGDDPNGERPTFESSFEIRSVECGSGEDRASVSIDDRAVVVEGVIGGSNGCYTAEIADVSVDEGLVVAVESYEESEGDLCTQCLTDVAYEARISFDEPVPEPIVVEHDGSIVTEREER